METEISSLSLPIVKHSELKSLLTEGMKRHLPSFRFLTAATGVYHFQRIKDFRDYDLREAIHFAFSLSDHSMHVSISSRINHVHTLTPAYNNGLINPHVDLCTILNKAPYQSDGTFDSLTTVINEAFNDLTTHGMSFLESRWNDLQNNALINLGIDIIELWRHDRTMLRNEISVQLRKAKLMVSRLRHPICNDLREQLESIPNQTDSDRHKIQQLAFELIELYCNSRITS